jgi:hypothetical protein
MADFSNNAIGSAVGDLLGGAGDAISDFSRASAFGNNAEIDKIQAGMSTMMTRVDAARQEQRTYRIEGTQTAAASANGLNVSGSALDVLHETARQASLDKSLIEYKGGVNTQDWQLKRKSDLSAQHASTLSGVLDIAKGVVTAAAAVALL